MGGGPGPGRCSREECVLAGAAVVLAGVAVVLAGVAVVLATDLLLRPSGASLVRPNSGLRPARSEPGVALGRRC